MKTKRAAFLFMVNDRAHMSVNTLCLIQSCKVGYNPSYAMMSLRLPVAVCMYMYFAHTSLDISLRECFYFPSQHHYPVYSHSPAAASAPCVVAATYFYSFFSNVEILVLTMNPSFG